MLDDLAALRLQLEWGADEAVGEAALDRLAPARPAPITRPLAPPSQPQVAAAAPPSPEIPAAETLEQLIAALAAFEGCKLKHTATSTVRPDGRAEAALLLIGDAPGSEDDRSGRAFSGPGGAVLDRVLATAGLDRSRMLLTTLVPWRPPGGRPPTEAEIATCLPFLHRLIGIMRPERLVLLGSLPVRTLVPGSEPARRKRANWFDVIIPAVDTAIPALAFPPLDQWLSSPTTKQRLWSNLITLQKAITTV